jgi:16S rRNA C967 or C1407 C5-methylase (RsmB/RsmF family)
MRSEVLEKICSRYEGIAGGDAAAFRSSMRTRTPFSFRVNILKISAKEVLPKLEKQGIDVKPIPWCGDAFTSDKPISRTPENESGEIYAQELSSLLPALVMSPELKSSEMVLDACAAPGSKTTQMAAIMQNRGAIVANDSSRGRLNALRANLERCGVTNAVMTNYDFRKFLGSKEPPRGLAVGNFGRGGDQRVLLPAKPKFDAILLDAPCSGEGVMMENPDALKHWSESHVKELARQQKEMIVKAYEILASGGVLVYSTCTFAPEENEMVVGYLLEKTDARLEDVSLPDIVLSEGVTEWNKKTLNPELSKCRRVWPHKNAGMGGFFLAKLRKPG